MTAPPTPSKPFELALEPLDVPPTKAAPEASVIEIGVAPTRPAGPAPVGPVSRSADESPAPAPDRFVSQATREIQDGNLDQRLWARVLLVSGDDQ